MNIDDLAKKEAIRVLQTKGIEITCPSCKRKFTARSLKTKCPHCEKTFDVEFDVT